MKKTTNKLNSNGKDLTITKDSVIEALRDCYDPCCEDRGISVVDMGLIEDIKVNNRKVDIEILLTTGWCPSVSILFKMMKERIEEFEEVDNVDVKVVWDPVWTMERLSESARKKLTIPLKELIPLKKKQLLEQQQGVK